MNKKEKALRSGKKQPPAVQLKTTAKRSRELEMSSNDSRDMDRNLEKDNSHNRDINSKTVFGNAIL